MCYEMLYARGALTRKVNWDERKKYIYIYGALEISIPDKISKG